MVDEQVAKRGVSDPLVLAAMRRVKRHKFVSRDLGNLAYCDRPLPIGSGQTISQPYMVAMMIEALQLKGGEDVLEIGTGSGYAAAVLAEIADNVVTIERKQRLSDRARSLLSKLGYNNIKVITADGTKGCQAYAPYDAIVVTAGGPEVPQSLPGQLKVNGRLIIPVGAFETFQHLIRITRISEEKYREEELGEVRFVPLVGKEGWHQDRNESDPGHDLADG